MVTIQFFFSLKVLTDCIILIFVLFCFVFLPGARVDIKNNEGRLPLDLTKDPECAALIKQAGMPCTMYISLENSQTRLKTSAFTISNINQTWHE